MLVESASVSACHSATNARQLLTEKFDCLILDLGLPDVDGIEFVAECVERAIPVVVLTGDAGLTQAVAAMKAGAYDYLVKDSLRKERLESTVRKAIQTNLLQNELRSHREQLEVAQNDLCDRERRLSFIIENINEVFWIATLDRQRFLYVSPQARDVWGIAPEKIRAAPDSILDLISSEDCSRLVNEWSASEFYELEYRLYDSQDRVRWLREKALLSDHDGATLWVGTTEDVTERKELEAQFRSAERMRELGNLASGLSHDFNNILTCILGYTQAARETLPGNHVVQEDLTQVEEAGRQAQRLIKQLLGVSKSSAGQKLAYCDLKAVVKGMSSLLAHSLGETIKVEVCLPSDEFYVGLPQSQAEQIVLNLAVNARDAMPEGGVLTLSLELKQGQAELRVRDSGVGIAEDTRKRLFDAFFTTKGDQGTGLGLFTVSEILKSLGGDITVTSQLGEGSCFSLRMPIYENGKTLLNTLQSAPSEVPTAVSGRILLAENRGELAELFEKILGRAGYRVTRVEDGLEALMMMEQRTFELLITDLQMPGIGGTELAKRAASLYPDTQILFISGRFDMESHQSLVRAKDDCLQKPFSGPELVRAVERMFDHD